ncbi:spermatogenesis-associated protein 19, mitochondrial isoform X1 [Oryctolagus cuniculus]|uniref:spermatogenesis-associated protein 19, mitochondrial isoform X1 n=2 Tax=Oryctolagus cuniculus TaxID=9986 RepID=UPI003879DD93
MIITTWIVYILARKGAGLPFPPKTSSDIEVVESEAVSVVQHWLKKTEEEASQDIKEKMSTNVAPTRGQDVHVTRDVVKHHLSKSNLSANQSQEVLEERTRIQFIRWSHTRIFQVPSQMANDVMQERIEQVRRRPTCDDSHGTSCQSTPGPCAVVWVTPAPRQPPFHLSLSSVPCSISHITCDSAQDPSFRSSYSEC